jgi:hypothetical protein
MLNLNRNKMKTLQTSKGLVMWAVVIFGMSVFTLSCSKDSSSDPYVCAACHPTPDALAVNNASSKGIYKGIIVGSTGTIAINIQNGVNTVTATLVLDGTTVLLTSTVTPTTAQSYLAPFTGMYNGDPISLTFSVAANGSIPTIVTSDIPGHPNASFQIIKETSTALIEAFEGTYAKTGETGVFNIVLSSALGGWSGIAKNNITGELSDIDGTYANGVITESNGTVMGTITGDELHGSFQDGDGDTITITGLRTL